jgi:hypothetical protein
MRYILPSSKLTQSKTEKLLTLDDSVSLRIPKVARVKG